MKSTRSSWAPIMVLMALHPAPPTPRIVAAALAACSNSFIESVLESLEGKEGLEAVATRARLEDFLQPLPHPALDLLVDVLLADLEDAQVLVLGPVQDQAHARG